jgi:phospholipid/cholesterol/gamma-HCH transport system ATP-binding protein
MTASNGPALEVWKLSYAVGGTTVLDGVDLTVARSEIVGIMGRSGTGKTTLLRLIMGLVKPTAGRVLVFGRDIVGMGEEQLDRVRMDMGMVFQGAALFDSMTVAENVAFGLVEHRRVPRKDLAGRVRELLEMVDMSGSESLMPAQLSGGMRKRVGIARALAMEPSLMLYDEPTAGLDPISAAAIDALIVRLCEQVGVASVIASHDVPSLHRVSDRAALLHDGSFVAIGSMVELEASANPAVRQFLSGSPEGPITGEAG